MDPKLIYWTAALANLGVLCVVALVGVRCARRGEIARHRRAMKLSTALVVAFLLSYVVKLLLLGREEMDLWATRDVWVLRVHEVFVLVMLLAGAAAWAFGRRLRGTRLVTRDPSDPAPDGGGLRLHRLAGRSAVAGALLGFAMAVGVLIGMYARASAGPG